jgi:hypothetical protein
MDPGSVMREVLALNTPPSGKFLTMKRSPVSSLVQQSPKGLNVLTLSTVWPKRFQIGSYRRWTWRKTLVPRRKLMWGIIGAVLLLMWLLGFFAFHVTVGFIHILLVLAVISILYHLVAGRSATA